ncbi:hypothetical protein [Klebsiella pneumoniae]|uniref:hypothetical protein n=1 Tax=Klebsiella pneumoniae TaxID=573 RepID=UPI00098345DB|nr:hypothetical protein [Klebsiella pneumoniae]MDG0643324.1 ead/Ea22-like family protein [Klebsiella pneumoniae]
MTTDITELALLVSKAKASVFTLEYISQFEPADIDSDDVDLRFEVDGRDTGTNVSIVDECGQAAKVIGELVEALEKAQRANGHLREQSAEWERKAISNFEECAKLSQRVEELESRAVTVENLQESAYRAGLTAGWNLGLANNNDGFNKCLAAHAAGIKVEAE